jgi:hypothetical protein
MPSSLVCLPAFPQKRNEEEKEKEKTQQEGKSCA